LGDVEVGHGGGKFGAPEKFPYQGMDQIVRT